MDAENNLPEANGSEAELGTAPTAPEKFSDGLNDRLEKYIPLSFNLASQFRGSILSLEEIQQIALIGIARALETYVPGRSPERTWVYFKGYNAIKDALRSENRRRKHIVQLNWESSFEVEARKEDRSRRANLLKELKTDQLNALRSAMRLLDSRTRLVIKRVGLKGERQEDVGRSLGISQSWCSRIYNRGLNQLRDVLLAKPIPTES